MQEARMPAAGRVQQVFEEVLAQPEFRTPTSSPLAELVEAIARFLARWLPDVQASQVRPVAWLVVAAAVLFAARTLLVRFGDREGRAVRRGREAGVTPRQRTAADWAAWARGEALAGRMREAATGVYRAVILELEGRGAVRYAEWKTPGDYIHEVSGDASLRGPFRSFLGEFVELAFGPSEPTPEALASLLESAERLGCRA